jgi:hypothetical protein
MARQFKDNPLLMRMPVDQAGWIQWGREITDLLTGGTFLAIADGDATPSVKGGHHFTTANTGATVLTGLDDGYIGQEVVVKFGDANTDVDFTGTTLKGNGGADWTTIGSGDFMRCVYDGTNWLCQVTEI